jgi:hypothetical protein
VRFNLRYWNRRWQTVSFDSTRGVGRVRWLFGDRDQTLGWAYKGTDRWYAMWLDAGTLVFQAGTKRWPMSDNFQCRIVLVGQSRSFRVTRDGKSECEVGYKVNFDHRDPTLDAIDCDTQDFLGWAAKVWNDDQLRASVISGLMGKSKVKKSFRNWV